MGKSVAHPEGQLGYSLSGQCRVLLKHTCWFSKLTLTEAIR